MRFEKRTAAQAFVDHGLAGNPWSRRRVLAAGVGAAVLSVCAGGPASADPAGSAGDGIAALERRYFAVVGVYAHNLATGATVAHRDNDVLALCSTFKAYAAGIVLHRAQRGQLRLEDTAYIDPNAVVSHSPVTGPRAGTDMTLAQLCEATLQTSDNTAANLLLARLGGPSAITDFARSLGDERTRLDRWETELNSAEPGDPRDTSTPRALGGGYRELLAGNALDDTRRAQLDTWMRGNITSAKSMRAGLPPGWTSADKTGAGGFGSTNDVGIAYGPDGQRILLAVMTRSRSEDPEAPAMQALIADVTRVVLPVLLG